MKKKVLHFISDLERNGAQTVVMNYLRWFKDDSDIDMSVFIVEGQRETAYENECLKCGFNVFFAKRRKLITIPYLKVIVNNFIRQIEVWKIIKKIKPDIIHSHQANVVPCIAVPFFLSGIKNKFHTMHSDPESLSSYYVKWTRFALHCCGIKPLGVTEGQAKKAMKIYNLKACDVIHNGLDETLYKNLIDKHEIRSLFSIPQESFVIGFVGRFNRIKNITFLLQVFHNYNKKYPNSFLMLVGDGDEKPNILRKINDLGISNNVVLTGERKDVARLYKAMDVFMLTSLYESSSIVTVEAQLSGVRCVVADSIPDSVVITNRVNRIPLSAPISQWISAINGELKPDEQVNAVESFSKEGVTQQLKNMYLS